MGCDIHIYVEFKEPNHKEWQLFGDRINPGRCYKLFAKIANVRNMDDETIPISKPRGIPKDCCWLTKNESHCVDWHSHTWISVDEYENAISIFEVKQIPEWYAILAILKYFTSIQFEARIVCWFDN